LKDIFEIAKSGCFKAVLIDELILDEKAYICTESDKRLIEKLTYFWIAPRDKGQLKLLNEKPLDAGLGSLGLKELRLTYNMRNSKEVAEFIKKEYGDGDVKPLLSEILRNFPCGKKVHIINDPIECIKKALKSAHKGVLVIVGIIKDTGFLSQLTNLIGTEKAKSIGVLEFTTFYDSCKFDDDLLHYHRETQKFTFEHQQIGENIIDFLEKKGSILFVSANSIAGFEWPSVVCIGKILDIGKPGTEHFVNAYMRATGDLCVSNDF